MSNLMRTISRITTLLCTQIILYGCGHIYNKNPSTAFFYGKPIPEILLSEYDRVVVQYENLKNDNRLLQVYMEKIYIYISIGEAEPWRNGFSDISTDCYSSYNEKWGSYITNLACKEWHKYIIEKRIKPAWESGIRGFFLDTLDSYMALNMTKEQKEYQRRGLIELITSVHDTYPGIKLMLNRGFNILHDIKDKVDAVVVESLFLGWDQENKQFYKVSKDDREWLIDKLNMIKKEFNIPIVVIDYTNLENKISAYENVNKILSLGFTPWVTSPYLDAIGIGSKFEEDDIKNLLNYYLHDNLSR